MVDSDPSDQELLEAIARGIPAELVACDSGNEGLKRASQVPFDVIVLDILMPDMSGYELCRQLKARPDTADIPILFVTARNREEDVLAGFEALAFDFISKPYQPRELRARILVALRMRDLMEELAVRVRCYERCLSIGRQLAEAEAAGDAERIINAELEQMLAIFESDGLSFSLTGRPDFFTAGDCTGRLAAEIPFQHARMEGVFRIFRPVSCDADEKSRLAEVCGVLARGIKRHPDLLQLRRTPSGSPVTNQIPA